MSNAAERARARPTAGGPPLVFECDHWLRAQCLAADLAEVERDYLHDAYGIAESPAAPRTCLDLCPGVGALARRVALRTPGAQIVCLCSDASAERAMRRNTADLQAFVIRSDGCRAEEVPGWPNAEEWLRQIGREFGLRTIDLVRLDGPERSAEVLSALCRAPLAGRIVGRVLEPQRLKECVARQAAAWRLRWSFGGDGAPLYSLARGTRP